jgi:hypothetical protein
MSRSVSHCLWCHEQLMLLAAELPMSCDAICLAFTILSLLPFQIVHNWIVCYLFLYDLSTTHCQFGWNTFVMHDLSTNFYLACSCSCIIWADVLSCHHLYLLLAPAYVNSHYIDQFQVKNYDLGLLCSEATKLNWFLSFSTTVFSYLNWAQLTAIFHAWSEHNFIHFTTYLCYFSTSVNSPYIGQFQVKQELHITQRRVIQHVINKCQVTTRLLSNKMLIQDVVFFKNVNIVLQFVVILVLLYKLWCPLLVSLELVYYDVCATFYGCGWLWHVGW